MYPVLVGSDYISQPLDMKWVCMFTGFARGVDALAAIWDKDVEVSSDISSRECNISKKSRVPPQA
jgi:hypothetical protein